MTLFQWIAAVLYVSGGMAMWMVLDEKPREGAQLLRYLMMLALWFVVIPIAWAWAILSALEERVSVRRARKVRHG
jgi:hypothetical protein